MISPGRPRGSSVPLAPGDLRLEPLDVLLGCLPALGAHPLVEPRLCLGAEAYRKRVGDVRAAELREQIERVWEESFAAHGVPKVWRQRRREGVCVARCTVEGQLREMGVQGAVRGRKYERTGPSVGRAVL